MTSGSDDSDRVGVDVKSMRTHLRIYETIDGVPSLRDSQVARLFELAKKDNVLEPVLFSEDVENMTAQYFVQFYKRPGVVLALVYFDRKLAGWLWLDDIGRRTARIHFCGFRWMTRERQTVRCAMEALWQVFNLRFKNGASLNVLRGETPGYNKLAIRFFKRLGMKVIAEVPMAALRFKTGDVYSMVYTYVTKDLLEKQMTKLLSKPAVTATPVDADAKAADYRNNPMAD